jgi:hypothetical protein
VEEVELAMQSPTIPTAKLVEVVVEQVVGLAAQVVVVLADKVIVVVLAAVQMAAELVVEAELAVQVPTTCPVLAVLVVEPV